MNCIFLIFLFLFPSKEFKNKYFTFSKEDYFVIVSDSIYLTRSGDKFESFPMNLYLNKFNLNHLEIDDKSYLILDGGGVVYSFENKRFKRIDNSFEHKNKFFSYDFVFDNIIYSFGGYGLFNDNNLITYFDNTTNEWFEYGFNSSSDKIPKKRKYPVGQLVDQDLYIGLGVSKIIDNKFNPTFANNSDFWKFNFETRIWENIGSATNKFLSINDFNENSSHYLPYKNGNLLITYEGAYWLDVSKNIFREYRYPNNEVINDISSIVYNPVLEKFMISNLDHKTGNHKFIFLTSKQFLGEVYSDEFLYKQSTNLISILVFTLIVLFLILVYHLRTKNDKSIHIILRNIEIFKSKLSDQEYVVFKNIIDSYPNAVTFPNLLSIYEPDLSYESRIKKLRLSLFNIKTLLRKVSKNSTISVRKNKNDRRIKEIFFE